MNVYPVFGKAYCAVCRKEIKQDCPIAYGTTRVGTLQIAHLECVDAVIPPITKEYPKKKWWQL